MVVMKIKLYKDSAGALLAEFLDGLNSVSQNNSNVNEVLVVLDNFELAAGEVLRIGYELSTGEEVEDYTLMDDKFDGTYKAEIPWSVANSDTNSTWLIGLQIASNYVETEAYTGYRNKQNLVFPLEFTVNNAIKDRNGKYPKLGDVQALYSAVEEKIEIEKGNAEAIEQINKELDEEYVQFTDYPTATKAGAVKVNNANGIGATDGNLFIYGAENANIDARKTVRPITPLNLEYAVKSAMTTNTITMSLDEKANACEWIGAVPRVYGGTGLYRLYGVDAEGNSKVYDVASSDESSVEGRIPYLRSTSGNGVGVEEPSATIAVGTPKQPYQAANKKFVEDYVETALDGIEIGGGGSTGTPDFYEYVIGGLADEDLTLASYQKTAICKNVGAVQRETKKRTHWSVYATAPSGYDNSPSDLSITLAMTDEKVNGNIVIPVYFPANGSLGTVGDGTTVITNTIPVAVPLQPYQAANKKYVDEKLANITGGSGNTGGITEGEVDGKVEGALNTAKAYTDTKAVASMTADVVDEQLTINLKNKDNTSIASATVNLPSGGGDVDLSNCVKYDDVPSTTKAGPIKLPTLNYGIEYVAINGALRIKNSMNQSKISGRAGYSYEAVTLNAIDDYVVAVMTNPLVSMTADDKEKACAWIGAAREGSGSGSVAYEEWSFKLANGSTVTKNVAIK